MYEVMNDELASFKEKAHRHCQEFVGGLWETISLEDFQFDIVQGGYSNKLYCCTLPENSTHDPSNDHEEIPRKVLMRIYGKIQSGQEARLREITIFTLLSERNLGPKLYGLFSEGRLEEYIPSKLLKWNELVTHGLSISKELAKIHALQLPIRKEPLFPSQVYEFLEFAEKNVEQMDLKPFHQALLKGGFRSEIEWLMKQIKKMNLRTVFCHNDLHGGNILLMDSPRTDDKNLMFIDFEFSAYNYRAFDIAHHFNTRCVDFGVTGSALFCHFHPNKFPTESEQIEFIDVYLNQLQEEGVSFPNDFQTEQNKLLREIPLFRLAVCAYLAIAFFKFGSVSTYDIPYLEWIKDIWMSYETLKEEYIQKISQENAA